MRDRRPSVQSATTITRQLAAATLICLAVGLSLASETASTEERHTAERSQPEFNISTNRVQFANGYLTIHAEDAALDELLGEIARQSGLIVKSYSRLDQRLSDRFEQLPLDQALRRILRKRSFVLEFKAKRSTTLWIVPEGQERATAQRTTVQPMSGHTGRQVSAAMHTTEFRGTPDLEEAALALGKSTTDDAVTQLSLALIDENPDVRSAAVSSLADIGSTEAVQALAVALSDPDPRIREGAVNSLDEIGGEAAVTLLELALADEEVTVRDAASEALETLRGTRP